MINEKKYQPLMSPSISVDKATNTHTYGQFVIAPLESGFGHTIGNTLRRILLGGIEGSAVVAVSIEGVNNAFSTLTGVMQDVMRILLNVKMLVIKNESGEAGVITIETRKAGDLYAKDLVVDSHLKIINEDLLIATLAEDGYLKMKLYVESGRGYQKAK